MQYLFLFITSGILTVLLTIIVKHFSLKQNILDMPEPDGRKIHKNPVPLLGGLALIISVLFSIILYLYLFKPNLNIVPLKFFLGIIFANLVLALGGFWDDKHNLPPKILWIFPALASLIVVLSGIGVGIKFISNPFGGSVYIGQIVSIVYFKFSLSALLVWIWLMGMIFTTKFLDGLDGLCSGIGLIGSLTFFCLSLTEKINQPITAGLAIILAGALFGYLFFAFYPASIFLGESGSTFIGLMLGVLSVILGAKIATALLVMGIPILDVAWAIIRRLYYKQSPFKADKSHLHHRLLDIGFSQKQAVLGLWAISASFGATALFLQSKGKLIALIILFVTMLIIALGTVILYKRRHPHISNSIDGK
jgi:UDP-GlcNAc:undecaprenyl-phosphate GlcNAc-1-phosphate transferase